MQDHQPKNIAGIYLMVKQRERRDAKQPWAKFAARARIAARAICDTPTLEAVRAFAEREIEWNKRRERSWDNMLWPDFYYAIKSGDFINKRSTINNYLSGHRPKEGWFYLLTSLSRQGQVKIGYTTQTMRRRLLQIRSVQDEPDVVVGHARWVKNPSRLENELQTKYGEYRVRGNATGESIEWFAVDFLVCKERMQKIIIENPRRYDASERQDTCIDTEGHEVS